MSTTLVHPHYPTQAAPVERAASLRRLDPTRASASLLLAAVVSSLVVVANQVVDTWTEGHLLVAWIVLWIVAFAALALFAAPARSAAKVLRSGVSAWNERRQQDAQDEQYWQAALQDARLMADISRAMSQSALRDIKAYY